jgi:hypothetical protein
MIPKKPALGLDHRKSDVSDLRPCKNARTREHPSSGGGYRFSEKIMLHQKSRCCSLTASALDLGQNSPISLKNVTEALHEGI